MVSDDYPKYTICNVYFDTDSYELISKSIEKPFFKEKLRLRSYGTPKKTDTVFLEIKRKVNGVVYKRRISMPYEKMEKYLKTGSYDGFSGQVFKEIDYFIKHYHPKPQLYLAYEREAYKGTGNDEALRVTFDSDIRWRERNVSICDDSDCSYMLDSGQKLMEVKANGAMPIWLCEALSRLNVFPFSFSKYGTFYKKKLTDTNNFTKGA